MKTRISVQERLKDLGDEHHGVKVVGLHHHFDGVGDEIPAGQRVAHTAVALAQAVADGDGAGFAGDAAPLSY